MDFLNPEARDYYSSFYSYDNFPSTTPVLAGIWNDMNEPSVFDNSIEKTLPGDALHYGGVVHRDIHNIYGLLHVNFVLHIRLTLFKFFFYRQCQHIKV
jgi:alpha 1,3-glucosidase